MRKPSLVIIFLTVFIDLVGFGIVLPLLPRYSEKYGAEGLTIGAIIASFSIMQLVFSPVWGRLSDRIGRRPVLLLSMAGSALSYALFALAALPGLAPSTAVMVLLASRVFAGACGANISVASAYIADITPRESRSKGMALIGVAFGLGFIFGPVIGAVSGNLLGLGGPGWVAAGICASNFVVACFVLRESRRPDSEAAPARAGRRQWAQVMGRPRVGLLLGLYFLATFCFACFESTFPLLVGSPAFHPDDFTDPVGLVSKLNQGRDTVSAHVRTKLSVAFLRQIDAAEGTTPAQLRSALRIEFNQLIKQPDLFAALVRLDVDARSAAPQTIHRVSGGGTKGRVDPARANREVLQAAYASEIKRQSVYYDERRIGYLFAYCGLVSALIQGGVIGRLVKRFGEAKLVAGSLLVVAVSQALMPYAGGTGMLLATLALFSAASGVNRAPTIGLISIYTPAEDQGTAMGVTQSAGTLARICGPLVSTALYDVLPHSPYVVGAGIALAGSILAWLYLCHCETPAEAHGQPG